MILRLFLIAGLLAIPAILTAQPSADETLAYLINWPSGLSLGEAVLTSKKIKTAEGEERWQIEFRVNAAIPGFSVMDSFRSEITAASCSIQFERDLVHGKRKGKERITFDQKKRTAKRETIGGGKSDLSTPPCAKDSLAFLFFVRQELKAGRIPPAQPVYYGAAYQVRLEYSGTEYVRNGDSRVEADKVVGTIKGPSSNAKFEAYFARDPGRTPLLAVVPLPVGRLTLELSR
jgi:hypothetical protein